MTRARLSQASIKKGAVALAAVLLALTLGFVVYNHQRGERYAEAVRLAEAGDASGAYAIFVGLGGYADAAQRGAGLVEKDPAVPYRRAAKGDVINFGSFEQDGNEANGPEPIQWIVLERFDDRLLVLSADVLEARQYNHVPFQDVTWADSDLRAWMNGDFFASAFTPAQQGIIPSVLNENADQSIAGTPGGAPTQDRVFAAPVSQAAASGSLAVSEDGTADWWLRSPGTYAFAAQYVDTAGTPLPSGANVDVLYGVRPALWIDIAEVGGGQQ